MSSSPIPDPSVPKPIEQFLGLLRRSLDAHELIKVILGKNRGPDWELIRVSIRPLRVRDQECLSFLYHCQTKDITENTSLAIGIGKIHELLATSFQHGHLLTMAQDVQLTISKKGKATLSRGKPTHTDAPTQEHDREKERFLDLNKPLWVDLAIANDLHQLLPSMSRKWKQINKFIEVFDHAFKASGLQNTTPVRVVDFGCGKGYLTFAIHDHLRNNCHIDAQVTGIELREDLVRFCTQIVQHRQFAGLSFEPGDIASYAPPTMEIMIALHACDTATDHAIYKGIRAGASIILCSPCCHKQIRPQMTPPPLLRPVLRHGIHLDQEAEMVTDSLRALLLEAEGYATQVFEFISHEHTGKNKMILAVKRPHPVTSQEPLAQIQELKNYYGIREHCLETLLTTRK